MIRSSKGLLALSPLLVFLLVYVLSSLFVGDFGRVPVSSAFLIAAIWAVATTPGKLRERINCFSKGAGDRNILLMIWIFVLAGAFAGSAKDIGAIDATVAATLHLVPSKLIFCGLFLASCFISMSIGTSVGTIVALVPLATEMAANCGVSEAYMAAIIVGGAFFGDNLSFISDTTIVATNTQGCKQSDKFLVNSYTTIPVAIIVMVVYMFVGQGVNSPTNIPSANIIKIIPYLIVIISAICGLNVLIVLTLGILSTGVVGMAFNAFDFFGWCQSMGDGITAMGDLIVVALLAGGLLKTLSDNGALDYLIRLITNKISNRRSCELTIASLVSIVNVCTANNTVAILTVGSISKEIGDKFGVDNRKSASILDTFSCCIQSILPYGAQILMATGLAAVSPMDIISHLYYPFVLFAVSVGSILFRYPKKYS